VTFRDPRDDHLNIRHLKEEDETYGPFVALIIAALLIVGGLLYTVSGHGPLAASNIARLTPVIIAR